MTARILTYFQRFRRRTFPASNETSGYHFDATIAKFECLETLLSRLAEREFTKLNELVRAVAAIPDFDRRLASFAELDRNLIHLSLK